MRDVDGEIELELVFCCVCGVPFGIEEHYYNGLRDQVGGMRGREGDELVNGFFSCPNGHKQRYDKCRSDELKARLVDLSRKLEKSELRVAELNQELTRANGKTAKRQRNGSAIKGLAPTKD